MIVVIKHSKTLLHSYHIKTLFSNPQKKKKKKKNILKKKTKKSPKNHQKKQKSLTNRANIHQIQTN